MTKKINLVAVNMGYGHQRAAYPLLSLSGGEIISINDYPGIPEWEKKYWQNSEESYNRISRFKKVPILGQAVFGVMDAFQKIRPYYPFRDLSALTEQQKFFFKEIKKGLGKHLVESLNDSGLPFVTTFFVAAYAAEFHGYKGDIYCIVCDSDASRAWAPVEPKASRIKYLLPTAKLKKRFLMYGVREENIFVTGFPLPEENIGPEQETLKADLSRRLQALDISGAYRSQYGDLPFTEKKEEARAISLTFAVGGAGAQTEIGVSLLGNLKEWIKAGKLVLNLVAGNRLEVRDRFAEAIKRGNFSEGQVNIIYASDKIEYFRLFNICLRSTDILWTKPSELSLYCGLGLPVVIAEPVGSQEDFNREWLIWTGAGLDAPDPEYANEWLEDNLLSGRLARAAVDGFRNAENQGTENIKRLIIN